MSDKNKKTTTPKSLLTSKERTVAIRETEFPEGPAVEARRHVTRRINDDGTVEADTLYFIDPRYGKFFKGHLGENPDPSFIILGGNRVTKNGKTVSYNPGNLGSGFTVYPAPAPKPAVPVQPTWRTYARQIPVIGKYFRQGGYIEYFR